MTNKQILEKIEEIQRKSVTYNLNNEKIVSKKMEISEDTICPSEEFFDDLFKECSRGLGFEYEKGKE